MRILQLTPQLPWPPDNGGRVGIFNILKNLARHHSITLVSFVTEVSKTSGAALEPYCDRIITVQSQTASSKWGMFKNLFSAEPYTMAKFFSPKMAAEIRAITHSGAIDLVHIDHLHMAGYIDQVPPGLPIVLREHNIESAILRRFAEHASNPAIRWYVGLQAQRLKRYEATMAPLFDRCITVTDVDASVLRQMAPAARVEAIPAGVDTELFHPNAVPVQAEPFRIVTTGDYSWAPTADGLTQFVRTVFPLIRASLPEVRLSVVGRNPPDWLRRLTPESGIDTLGRVADVRPEILRGAVFVVPTRIGSGIRLKILEAMALGRPVVSTSIGCEGIDAVNGVNLVVADAPDVFAAAVVRLLGNPSERDRLAAAAVHLIETRYTWAALVDQLSALYETLVEERSREADK